MRGPWLTVFSKPRLTLQPWINYWVRWLADIHVNIIYPYLMHTYIYMISRSSRYGCFCEKHGIITGTVDRRGRGKKKNDPRKQYRSTWSVPVIYLYTIYTHSDGVSQGPSRAFEHKTHEITIITIIRVYVTYTILYLFLLLFDTVLCYLYNIML